MAGRQPMRLLERQGNLCQGHVLIAKASRWCLSDDRTGAPFFPSFAHDARLSIPARLFHGETYKAKIPRNPGRAVDLLPLHVRAGRHLKADLDKRWRRLRQPDLGEGPRGFRPETCHQRPHCLGPFRIVRDPDLLKRITVSFRPLDHCSADHSPSGFARLPVHPAPAHQTAPWRGHGRSAFAS